MWLSIVQGILLTLVAWLWLQLSSIFAPEGDVSSSLAAMVSMMKGWVHIALALIYFVFAAAAWQTKAWAWWIGLLVAVLSMLTIASILFRGGSVVMALFWAIVPIVLLWYLLSPAGRQAFTR
jgi:hypothetical protein